MTTPQPRRDSDALVSTHGELDDRLTAAFQRYDQAFNTRRRAPRTDLVTARMDLSLLLWEDEEAPLPVQEQLAADADDLLRETPPL